jgi:integrase
MLEVFAPQSQLSVIACRRLTWLLDSSAFHRSRGRESATSGIREHFEQTVATDADWPRREQKTLEFQSASNASLYSAGGARKYLTGSERTRFLTAAQDCHNPAEGAFALTLAYTGMRISEALSLTCELIQPDAGIVAVRSLKKRGNMHFREIPAPPALFAAFAAMQTKGPGRIWTFQRTHAWEIIKGLMAEAGIPAGVHATPKGLRHGFGIHAVRSRVPLPLIQRWLGHSRMETTAIYLQAVGDEEREFAQRMWN